MEAAPDASLMLKDRVDAGHRLAERLERYRGENPIVIGTHRGATPVAFEVARSLNAPLDVLVVRELIAPDARGKVLGAVAEENIHVIDPIRAANAGHSASDLAPEIARMSHELATAALKYRQGQPPLDLTGRLVVLVASGLTHCLAMRAVIDAVRARGAQRIIVAIGVCSRPTAQEIRRSFDEIIVLRQPEHFLSVGEWFRAYPPLADQEVIGLLRSVKSSIPPRSSPEPSPADPNPRDPVSNLR